MEEGPGQEEEKRQPAASQEERAHQKPTQMIT